VVNTARTAIGVGRRGEQSRPGRDNLRLAPGVAQVTAAATLARDRRAHFLVDVLNGKVSTVDAPWAACESVDRRLLRIRLRELLSTAPLWDAGRSNAALGHMAAVLGVRPGTTGEAALAWLVDPRSAGRRVLAWLDAFRPRTRPWPGFPFAPLPETFPSDWPGRPPGLVPRDRSGKICARR
jgi:hypothetical protein